MTINEWLEKFKEGWLGKNVEDVLSLFSKDVTYYETPYIKVDSYDQLKEEWSAIREQKDMYLNLQLFTSQENKHTVIWHLGYSTSTSSHRELSGTYLIKLNDEGLCTYFHQTGELKPNC